MCYIWSKCLMKPKTTIHTWYLMKDNKSEKLLKILYFLWLRRILSLFLNLITFDVTEIPQFSVISLFALNFSKLFQNWSANNIHSFFKLYVQNLTLLMDYYVLIYCHPQLIIYTISWNNFFWFKWSNWLNLLRG